MGELIDIAILQQQRQINLYSTFMRWQEARDQMNKHLRGQEKRLEAEKDKLSRAETQKIKDEIKNVRYWIYKNQHLPTEPVGEFGSYTFF